VDIRGEGFGAGIQASLRDGFAYWDARVDDSRLVLATARDAVRRGAQLRSRCEVLAAKRSTNWRVMLQDSARHRAAEVEAKLIVNTAGPWVNDVLEKRLSVEPKGKLRLVKGSHIVVPAQYPGEHAFILQNEDRRMVFMIPYLGAYTLIGTTDVPDDALDKPPRPHGHEVEYLFAAANMHLVRPIGLPNLVWLYSGLRPLFDDGSEDPSQVTRDYRIIADGEKGVAPVITVYGGKITTFRHLAEMVVNETATWFSGLKDGWTENALLPGGDLGGRKFAAFVAGAQAQFPKLPPAYLAALVSRHGADVGKIIGGVESETDLGQKFAENLYAREVDRMIEREWALTADDVLWRRSKAGIGLGAEQRDALDDYIKNKLPA
jgi:glycerol-3-phosphate dehydrogenase